MMIGVENAFEITPGPFERAAVLPEALSNLGAQTGEGLRRLFLTSEGLFLVAGLVFVGYQARKWFRNKRKTVTG